MEDSYESLKQSENGHEGKENDDSQYMNLRKNYAFDPVFLQRNFHSHVIQLVSKSRIKLKLYQLFSFRLKYTGVIPIDSLLFYYSSYIPKYTPQYNFPSRFDAVLKFDMNKLPGITISKFLSDDFFRNIPYIRDIFCYSTFPSMFGNFIAEEYFEAGYKFIKDNFNDQGILPLLVSSFLNHSMLFQDRLISTFITQIIQFVNSNGANQNLKESINSQSWPFNGISIKKSVEIFMQSFKECMSYMNQYQLQIVQDLWSSDKNLTLYIISELFLKDILQSLSKYHTLSDHTNILTADCSFINPPNTAYIIRHNILSEIYNYLNFEQIIQLMIDSPTCFEFAKIKQLIFNSTCNRVLSVSDYKIITLLGLYILNKEDVTLADLTATFKEDLNKPFTIDEFTNDLFTICNGISEGFGGEDVPEANVRSKDELKMCRETRIVHKFLMSHSGYLNKLQICTEATIEVVNAKIREYIEQILFKQQVFEPSEYEYNEIVKYSKLIFQSKIKNLKPRVRGFDVKQFTIDDSTIDIFVSEIVKGLSRIHNDHNELEDFCSTIIEKIISFINGKIPDEINQLLYSPNDIEITRFSTFLHCLSQVSFRLRIAVFNKEKIPQSIKQYFDFEPKEDEERKDCLTRVDKFVRKLVNTNSIKITKDDYDVNYDNFDCDEFEEDNYDEIRSIILSSSMAMERDSNFLRSDFNIGNKIQSFAVIEKLIEQSVRKTNFLSIPENKRFIFYKIFQYSLDDLIKDNVYKGNDNDQNQDDDDDDQNQNEKIDESFNSKACFYFRANLIRARHFLKQIVEKEKDNLLMQTELKEVHKRLNKLNEFLNLHDVVAA